MSIADPPALSSLDPLHRDVLVLLALEDERVSRPGWQERVEEGGIVDADGRALEDARFESIVDLLVVTGAAESDSVEYRLSDDWLAAVIDDAHRRRRLLPITKLLNQDSGAPWGGLGTRGELLTALATGDAGAAKRLEPIFFSPASMRYRSDRYSAALGLAPPPSWLAVLSPLAVETFIAEAVSEAFFSMRRLGAHVVEAALAVEGAKTRALAAILVAFTGDVARARAALEERQPRSAWNLGALAVVTLVGNDASGARRAFAEAGTGARGQRVELPEALGLLDALVAITSDDAVVIADAPRRLRAARRASEEHPGACMALEMLIEFRRDGKGAPPPQSPMSVLDALFIALACRWMDVPVQNDALCDELACLAEAEGYGWIAGEIGRARRGEPAGGLLALFGRKESWELALDTLRGAGSSGDGGAGQTARTKSERLLWWTVSFGRDHRWLRLEPYLVGPRSGKGTRASVAQVEQLDDRDQRVVEAMNFSRASGDPLLAPKVLVALVGHPRVRDDLGRQLSIVLAEPRLEVVRTEGGVRVVLHPPRFEAGGVAAVRVDDQVLVYRETPASRRALAAIPSGALDVPQRGLPHLFESLAALGDSIEVVSDEMRTEASRPADPRLHVQLVRTDGGIQSRVRVLPAGEGGVALRPAASPGEIVVEEGSGLVRVVRDLAAERKRLDALFERCPMLTSLEGGGIDGIARDLETCLELVFELRDSGPDVIVEWIEGQPLRAPVLRAASNVRVRVKDAGAWLTVEGELVVDESRVVAMTKLLEARANAPGRFVAIGEDEYIVLTDDLRKKLDALARVQQLSSGGRIPGALLSIDELWTGMDVSFSKKLEKRRVALESASQLAVTFPRGLTAELRDYQRDGFEFLARRAAAGLGACLADDMGLGKTVQAIALLLHRRKAGPALVIVPTSVRRNWESELARFAPSLVARRFGDGDRAECVASAAAGDVVLVTYGLLVAEEALLAGRSWGTLILDEAHALKNASTQRARAARGLRVDAIVALTGTPLENHAGELHSLFDLLVPGLLGTRTTFERALGTPIASGDRDAVALLRRIVRPFVLRRTRDEVLEELPPRTEMVQVVPPSAAQLAFYEAIRRKALASLAAARDGKKGAATGKARIALLAEITRLRRAAIDPRLVGGETAPAGTKLDALVELVVELRAERRRALVFSQFLEVLDLARARLEAVGAACLRLDGTMSEATRATAVAGFQEGTGDVLLVSLKAGGTGLNLTAADFVIFLDPWWNPAVEDQATARAHRMGQSRPVTVVRLVTEGTIEEKVLALHATKRKLYEDIVSEADGSGTLSVDAIGALLGD